MRDAFRSLGQTQRLTQPLAATLFVAFAVSCAGESDGVPARMDLPVRGLVEEMRIGSHDDPELALTSRGTFLPILPDADGNIWVLQHEDQQLRLYDVRGAIVRTVGRMGEGPGEFMGIGGMGWWGGRTDTLWVADFTLRRVSLFTAKGAFARSVPLPEIEYGDSLRVQMPHAIGPDGHAIAVAGTKPGLTREGPVPILSFDIAAGVVRRGVGTLNKTGTLVIRSRGATVSTGVHPISDAPFVVHAPDGSRMIIVERSTAPEADTTVTLHAITSSGDTLWSRRFPYAPLALPATEVDSLLAPRIEGFKRFARLERKLSDDEAELAYRESVQVPGHRPPIRSARVALDGQIWLEWNAPPGVPGDWWLLDAAGEPQSVVRPSTPIAVAGVAGDHLWAVELDELDVPYLVRYRVGDIANAP